jgi:hypothetical protein
MRNYLLFLLLLISFSASAFVEPYQDHFICTLSSVVMVGTNGTRRFEVGMREDNKMHFWTNLTIGTGTGAASITSQSGLNPGDVVSITQGAYGTPSVWSNIVGAPNAHILFRCLNSDHSVFFTGGLNIYTMKFVDFVGFSFVGNGIDLRGPTSYISGSKTQVSNLSFSKFYFKNITSACFNNYNNVVCDFTGDTTLYAGYKMKYDSMTMDFCTTFKQGSFGTAGNGIDFWLYDSVTRCLFNDVNGGGNLMPMTSFEAYIAYWTVYQVTPQGYQYDKGIVTGGGGGNGFNGTIHDFYIYGKVAVWGGRINAYRFLNNASDRVVIYNFVLWRKATFGGWVIQSRTADFISGKLSSCSFWVSAGFLGDCPTLNTFWNPVVDVGCCFTTASDTAHIFDVFGFDNAFTGKTPVAILDESGGGTNQRPTWDTSHNRYGPSATFFMIDSSGTHPTGKPLAGSPLIGAGIAVRAGYGGTTDLVGVAWATTRSIGPYEYVSGIIPPPCQCSPVPSKYTISR